MKKIGLIIMLLCGIHRANAQVVDEIVAVVADKIILRSDIEISYEQASKELGIVHDSLKCKILEQKLIENLMILKAQIDSLPLNEERVDAELEERVKYFAQQYGGGKALEEIYGKSISEIKASNRERIRNNQLRQVMEAKIIKDVKVNPTDIHNFFNELKIDSLPYYSAEVELAQIIIEPKVSHDAKMMALEKVQELRKRIVEGGEKFGTLARIYSNDEQSAKKGGELGYFARGMMVPEFEGAAFKLKPDSISRVVETKYGYHIIQAIQRKGEEINVRHILIMPKIYSTDIELAKKLMDSIIQMVKMDSIIFEKAAKAYSNDETTKSSGGFIGSGGLGNTHIPVDELNKELNIDVQSLNVEEIGEPELINLPGTDQKKAWRVLYLKSETPPHRANLRDDYQKLQAMAFEKKLNQIKEKWIARYRKQFYIQINGPYADCPAIQNWIQKK